LHTLDCDADPPAPAPDIAWLDHPRLSAEEVRAAMDGIEREHALEYDVVLPQRVVGVEDQVLARAGGHSQSSVCNG